MLSYIWKSTVVGKVFMSTFACPTVQTISIQSNIQMFSLFSGRHIKVNPDRTQLWKLDNGFCKFLPKNSTNVWGLGKRTVLSVYLSPAILHFLENHQLNDFLFLVAWLWKLSLVVSSSLEVYALKWPVTPFFFQRPLPRLIFSLLRWLDSQGIIYESEDFV